jgi:DNA polymerase-3 subunit beta
MVAVDGFRLAVRREPLEKIEGGAFSFVAPGSALNEVEKICEDSDDCAGSRWASATSSLRWGIRS